jgi:hypothetical protein
MGTYLKLDFFLSILNTIFKLDQLLWNLGIRDC